MEADATAAGVDVGGTFTDVVVLIGDGPPRAVKVPTTPEDQSAGLVEGLAVAGSPQALSVLAHGTTTATNAILERRTARTVLVTTEGFRDLLEIGRQDRPSLYDLAVVRPEPLVERALVVPVAERMSAEGAAIMALQPGEIDRVVDAVAALAPEAVAVCLLFSYANDAHERALCDALVDRLDVPVTRSSELLPEFREFERASTCALDAAVGPVMRRYLGALRNRVPDVDVSVMTSGGGVAALEAAAAAPVLTLLSGPAAGVVAAAATARDAGFPDALAFDMGGTSTDVCLIRDGRPEIATAASIGGLVFGTPSVAIHTVGAGGGSLAWIDSGGALRVGPQSAGAVPGPACYGRGGQAATVTDAHAALGHLLDGQPLGSGGLTLDRDAAAAALSSLPGFDDARQAAAGVVDVVHATMLRALQRVSTEQGVDPSGLALVAYGGAGPLHAAALARDLGCAAAVIPPAPGVLSALGLLLAPPRKEVSRTVMVTWDADGRLALDREWEALDAAARNSVSSATVALVADCRYAGQSHELRIPRPADGDLAAAFAAAHATAYGYALDDEVVEVVTLRAIAEGVPALDSPPAHWDHGDAASPDFTTVVLDGADLTVPVVQRGALAAGAVVEGPALVVQADTTAWLAPGDVADLHAGGSLVVRW